MADPDADAWFLDDDTTIEESANAVDGDNNEDTQETGTKNEVEAPKPPAEWRKTYKLAVSTSTIYYSN